MRCGESDMSRKMLVRDAKRIALERMEESARTHEDFEEVVKQWNYNDSNRRRRERYNEISRPNAIMLHWDRANPNDEEGFLRSDLNVVIPSPIGHRWWRLIMQGDFIDTIYDNPDEMWQLVEDWDISSILKSLTKKQKEVFYLSVVRLYSNPYIAYLSGKTDRAVRKLFAETLTKIQDKLYIKIEHLVKTKSPNLTFDKGIFYTITKEKKETLDKAKSDCYSV